MRIFFLVTLLLTNNLIAQQIFVTGTNVYQFNLLEMKYAGKVEVVSKIKDKKLNESYSDTINYVVSDTGIYNIINQISVKLEDFFEENYKDTSFYKRESTKIKDATGKSEFIYDTVYKYGSDSLAERVFVYPSLNLFVYRRNSKADSSYYYFAKVFDREHKIKKIIHYGKGLKVTPNDNVLNYLSQVEFRDAYEFAYQIVGKRKKVSKINYYRYNSEEKRKWLHSTNQFIYKKNGLIQKGIFKHFANNDIVSGEAIFKYHPNISLINQFKE